MTLCAIIRDEHSFTLLGDSALTVQGTLPGTPPTSAFDEPPQLTPSGLSFEACANEIPFLIDYPVKPSNNGVER